MSLFLMFVGGALFGLWVGYLEGRRVGFAQGIERAGRTIIAAWNIRNKIRDLRSDAYAGDHLTQLNWRVAGEFVRWAAQTVLEVKR